MFFCLVAIGGFYEIDDVNIRLGPIATFTVVLFNVAYGVGAGPIPFTFSAEAFPLSYRGMHHPSPNLYMSHLIGLLVYRSRNELQCHGQFPWAWLAGALRAQTDAGSGKPRAALPVLVSCTELSVSTAKMILT